MTTNLKKLLLSVALIAPTTFINAANPVVKTLPSGTVIGKISDNGLWGVSVQDVETESGEFYSAGGSLWNLATMTATPVSPGASGRAGLSDVTNDGTLIVGSFNDKPAYWSASTGEWTTLPLPEDAFAGQLLSVTPDGTRAVGLANLQTEWDAIPVAYDLTSNSLLSLSNLPTKDMNHEDSELSIFYEISADGRYILGRLSQQILMPISMCSYVYDTQTNTYDFIGFTPNDRRPWTPAYSNCLFIDQVEMSPSGNYVTGMAYIGHEVEGSDFLEEYNTAFKYDVATKAFEVYDGPYDSDVAGFCITDAGLPFVSMPAVNPYADCGIRYGNYYYTLSEVMTHAYGLDWEAMTGETNTGRPIAISGDGKVLSLLLGPSQCVILNMTDDWVDAISKVNLLNNFVASPAPGSQFAKIETISLNFTREVGLSGAASRIKLLDSDGKTIQTALSAEANGKVVTIHFRSTPLDNGVNYSIEIPAGFITMSGDANVSSDKITLPYIGRNDTPVANTRIQPADGASFSRLDASTNCIYAEFDAQIKIADGARAQLWRVGDQNPLCDLDIMLYNARTILLYPLSRQYLYDGTSYKVVIPAGSVTDLSGAGPNAEITINYVGNYIREVSADDKYIFSDDCQTYDGFMFYDGDRLQPASTPAMWQFTADYPWYHVRDDAEATDQALAAHSMYSPAGKADDWAVTPQLYIPDDECYLQFEAQSYLKAKNDTLTVYAYACEDGYSSLTADFVNDIRTKGTIIFRKQLSPGESEETLAGEWTTYTVPLPDFAEKSIYLAFVNDNYDQSAVFLHRVDVIHDLKFLTSITSPSTVVNAASAPVAGTLSFISDLLTTNSIELNLISVAGDTVSTIKQTGLNLTNGKSFNFAFTDPLPLEPKKANRYSISVVINDTIRSSVTGVIKNLAFEPVRRVVLEEYSGRDCSNCPRGFVAMENLERIYPGQIIPVVLRTYESDPLGTGMASYTSFLGINNLGAPSAIINRNVACYPMTAVGNDYRFSGDGTSDITWLDAVVAEMSTMAEADLTLSAVYDGLTKQISIEGNTRFALNSSRNVNLFTVVLENKCHTEQTNGMRYFDDPDLGPWGKGGIYGQSNVELDIDHVGRGSFGDTFNGSAGLVPSIQEAGVENPFGFSVAMPETVSNVNNTELVIMMIDSDNDRIINANVCPISVVNSSITEINTDDEKTVVEYFDLCGNRVLSPRKGQLLIKRSGSNVSKIII